MKTALNDTFINNLKTFLKERKVSQKELANKMKVVPQALNKYIRGQRKPGIETLENISGALNVNPCELLISEESIPDLINNLIKSKKIDPSTFEKLFFSMNGIVNHGELIEEVNKLGGWRHLLDFIKEENLIREKNQQEYNKIKYKIIKSMQDKGYDFT